MSDYADRLRALEQYYQRYRRAEADPPVQNALLRAMSYLADRLCISVVSYILARQASDEQTAATGKQGAEAKEPPLPFACSKCNRRFASVKQCNGHQKAHRRPA